MCTWIYVWIAHMFWICCIYVQWGVTKNLFCRNWWPIIFCKRCLLITFCGDWLLIASCRGWLVIRSGYKDLLCSCLKPSLSVMAHINRGSVDFYQCHHCFTFLDNDIVPSHMKGHGLSQCGSCGDYIVSGKENLHHYTSYHPERVLPCPAKGCGRLFSWHFPWIMHVSHLHPDEYREWQRTNTLKIADKGEQCHLTWYGHTLTQMQIYQQWKQWLACRPCIAVLGATKKTLTLRIWWPIWRAIMIFCLTSKVHISVKSVCLCLKCICFCRSSLSIVWRVRDCQRSFHTRICSYLDCCRGWMAENTTCPMAYIWCVRACSWMGFCHKENEGTAWRSYILILILLYNCCRRMPSLYTSICMRIESNAMQVCMQKYAAYCVVEWYIYIAVQCIRKCTMHHLFFKGWLLVYTGHEILL